jgi:hypothetical protein
MLSRHGDVKRQGTPKAIGKDEKHPGMFKIQITLNLPPDRDWIECFRNPGTYRLDEVHPKLAKIWGNVVEFRSSEDHLEENIRWMDRYIGQANDCYHQRASETVAKVKEEAVKATEETEELERVNKALARL